MTRIGSHGEFLPTTNRRDTSSKVPPASALQFAMPAISLLCVRSLHHNLFSGDPRMTQAQLEKAVARATGETREVVRQMGFSLVTPPPRYAYKRRRRIRNIIPYPREST